jgi:hypothetical protein
MTPSSRKRSSLLLWASSALFACGSTTAGDPGEGDRAPTTTVASAAAATAASSGSGSGSGGSGGAGEPDPVFEIGTGETSFVPLIEGQGLEMVFGPQGGYHITMAIRCKSCGPQVTIHYGARDALTQEAWWPDDIAIVAEVVPHGEWQEVYYMRAFLESINPSDYAGKDAELWANLEAMPPDYSGSIVVRVLAPQD